MAFYTAHVAPANANVQSTIIPEGERRLAQTMSNGYGGHGLRYTYGVVIPSDEDDDDKILKIAPRDVG